MVENENLILEIIDKTEILGRKINLYNSIEEPLFEAQDVANWLGIKNVSQMLKQADIPDGEKGIFLKYTLGGNQKSLFITEDAMYDVLMTSRKQEAKPLRREIKLYLKQIRLTGGYIPMSEEDDEMTILAKALKIQQRHLEEKDTIIESQKKVIEDKDEVIKNQEKLISITKEKADAYDDLCESKFAHETKDAGKIIGGFGRTTFRDMLKRDKYLMEDGTPYQEYINKGLFELRLKRYVGQNYTYHMTYVTDKGITYFKKLYSDKAVTA